jgi:exopolysaccharide/PEP-CTERM locus tyrosine autokinase
VVPGSPAAKGGHIELDFAALCASGLMPPAEMAERLAEELRLIKRPLLLNAESDDARLADGTLVMIASALPGAGKTFISFNLAMSMASELDWSVLLVDADVSRRTLSSRLGLAEAPGLITLLEREDTPIADYVIATDCPGLQILPAGPYRANVKELLGSQRMRAVVSQLAASRHRHIILFDSPPLLLTSEARVLASYVGQVAVVVEAGVTPRRSLLEALEVLDPSKAINLILNKNTQMLGVGDYQYAGYELYGAKAETKVEG